MRKKFFAITMFVFASLFVSLIFLKKAPTVVHADGDDENGTIFHENAGTVKFL